MSLDIVTWKNNIFSVIKELSDEDYQTNIWLLGKGEEISSFNEAICGLYDDYEFEEFIRACIEKDCLSKEKIDALIEFKELLDSYLDNLNENASVEQILADKSWHNVRKYAEKVMKLTS